MYRNWKNTNASKMSYSNESNSWRRDRVKIQSYWMLWIVTGIIWTMMCKRCSSNSTTNVRMWRTKVRAFNYFFSLFNFTKFNDFSGRSVVEKKEKFPLPKWKEIWKNRIFKQILGRLSTKKSKKWSTIWGCSTSPVFCFQQNFIPTVFDGLGLNLNYKSKFFKILVSEIFLK